MMLRRMHNTTHLIQKKIGAFGDRLVCWWQFLFQQSRRFAAWGQVKGRLLLVQKVQSEHVINNVQPPQLIANNNTIPMVQSVNIAFAEIEWRFMKCPSIDQVCILTRPSLPPVCLLILSEAAQAVALTVQRCQIVERLQSLRQAINQHLLCHQQVGQILILPDAWQIVNGSLVATLKTERRLLEQRFAALAECQHQEDVVFLMEC